MSTKAEYTFGLILEAIDEDNRVKLLQQLDEFKWLVEDGGLLPRMGKIKRKVINILDEDDF